ncbi:Cleavage inducible protein [Phytophthora megakarya]|uniref:Cleavage inducible protein n=1 Tax=Phytophthora megakarya TaxID=4795 RepID=A0A225WJQ3_9STRA|nr:Cleavage inducible protein [Phytophthora megakarya]
MFDFIFRVFVNADRRRRTHLNEAIAQRRFVPSFIKTYTELHIPNQSLPEIIHATFAMSRLMDKADLGNDSRVQIQVEDFGGVMSMPNSDHSRPSAGYYKSNLILQYVVVADITHELTTYTFTTKEPKIKTQMHSVVSAYCIT